MDKSLVGALVTILALLVSGFVVLTVRGVATTEYLLFLGGPVVSAIVGAVLTQRTARVQAVVQKVEHQTNSLLTARLDRIDTELGSATLNRADKAATGGQSQTPTRIDTKLPPDVA